MASNEELRGENKKQLFAQNLEPVLNVAYRVAYSLTSHDANAQEIVQEAAILAFRHFDSFEQETNFKAWFMKILKNCFLMSVRKLKRHPQTVDLSDLADSFLYSHAVQADLHSKTPNPAEAMLQHATAVELSKALNELPAEYQLVAVFYFVDELTYQEIADTLDIPVGTVRSRLHRSRKMLQKALWPVAQESGLFPHASTAGEEHHESH